MSIAADSRHDVLRGAVNAAALDDHIETELPRYRDVIPFRDDEPLQGRLVPRSGP
jgi:hypothetical protein